MRIRAVVLDSLATSGLVNSGVLVQLYLSKSGKTVTGWDIAEVSAWSHVAPRYSYSGEAPRWYDDWGSLTQARAKELWRGWIDGVIEAEQRYQEEVDDGNH